MHAPGALRANRAVRRSASTLTVVAVAACAVCAAAQAQVTIGHLATEPMNVCSTGQFDVLPVGLVASEYAAPSVGVITSWSVRAAAGGDQRASFKTYRPNGGGGYKVAGRSDAAQLQPGVNTFKAALPVAAGDLIGIDYAAPSAGFACAIATPGLGTASGVGTVAGDAAAGDSLGLLAATAEAEPNVSATFLPAPTVTAVAPSAGSVSGGTKVAITGANFAEVRGVTFGSVPAVSFTVESESRISAVSPPSGALGETGVTVGTVAGSAAGTFTYRGCLVPQLRGKGLAAARRLLVEAGCRVGAAKTPRGRRARRGRGVRQAPRPSTVLPPGATVSLVLR